MFSQAWAQDCWDEVQSEFYELNQISQKFALEKGKPLEVLVEFEEKKFNPPKTEHYSRFSFDHLALDAGVVAGVMVSKNFLPKDKFQHVAAGALISYGATEIAKIFFKNQDHAKLKSILTGVATATIVGIAKELRDRKGHGTPDVKDALATSIGGALVSIRYSIKFK